MLKPRIFKPQPYTPNQVCAVQAFDIDSDGRIEVLSPLKTLQGPLVNRNWIRFFGANWMMVRRRTP